MTIQIQRKALEIARQGLGTAVDLLAHSAKLAAQGGGVSSLSALEALRAWSRTVEQIAAEVELGELFLVSPDEVKFDFETNEFFANRGAVRVRVSGLNGISPHQALKVLC